MAETKSVTSNVPKSGPRDVFMHLLAIVTLYASVISFIGLLWQYINIWYPDPLNYYYTSILNSIRLSASVLVVMYPVYVLIMWLINRDYRTLPAKRDIWVHKWLVYLTLFISALTVIIDIITLIYNFFGGEVSIRFVLKVLVVLITAGAVFGYYFFDLRDRGIKNVRILAWIVSILVALTIVGGFVIVGSPAHQRDVNFDSRRVSDLDTIQAQIVTFWQQKNVLPENLNQLTDSISGFVAPKDPQTNMDYEYIPKSDLGFQLCADFKLQSPKTDILERAMPEPVELYAPYNQSWNHNAGHVCFDRNIDPEIYKPIPQSQPQPVK